MKLRFLFVCLFFSVLVGCQPTVSVISVDLRTQEGVYIVAYTDDRTIRTRMEQQLADDLSKLQMVAITSYSDIDDITSSSAEEVIAKAMQKKLVGLLVINQVGADGSDNIVKNPKRISPGHPTLQEFYSYSKDKLAKTFPQNQEVFAEVNLFILDGGEAKLFWSGTTWSFQADNKGTAIRDMSDMIAKQLALVRDRYR